MEHPKERGRGFSRRVLLERAAFAGGGLAIGLLARCQNSTDMNLGKDAQGGGTAAVSQAGEVVQQPPAGGSTGAAATGASTGATVPATAQAPVPLGPGGIPLARRDRAVRLPILAGNEAIASGLGPEKGPLKIYNYSDYIDPNIVKRFEKQFGTTVQVSTFQSMDEAMAKLTTGKFDFDVLFGTIDRLPALVAQRLARPLNHDYIPNLAKNVWPELNSPYYDVDAQYTVPYTVYGTGIAWRNDKVDLDIPGLANPWDAFWQGKRWKGRVAIIDDSRDALGLPLLRDGVEDLNTEDPQLIGRAREELQQLEQEVALKIAYSIYQDVPEGKLQLSQSWSGDILAGALYYMPKGVPSSVMSYWIPQTEAPTANDTLIVLSKGKHPVLAHEFLNFMLDPKNAYDNFANFNGYQPPQNTLDFATLQKRLGLPDSLKQVVISREQWASGRSYLALTSKGEQLWQQAWSQIKAG